MNEITLKVNQEALVRNLKFGFTSQVTVLGELMQNARRAKASVVAFDYEESSHRLTVTDDGIGIGDLQQLVTVAESGWDAETIEREHPYGLGFLAAVYASEHITVESAGRRLAFATADLLAFRPLAVEPCDTGSGTRIVLEGLREIPHLEAALRHRAMGFPIEVRYNGESLPRPRALDGGFSFERTEVGEVYLYGAMPGEDWTYASDEIACYLQGLPVYACGYGGQSGRAAIVHLDPTRFLARLPDRDRLIDEPEAIDAVWAAIKAVALARLHVQKARLAPEAFIRGFRSLRHWGAVSLLNDVPFLPADVLWSITDYPIVPRWDGDGIEGYGTSIPEGSVEASEVRLAKLERMYEDEPGGTVRWVFAWKADYTLIDADFLDAEHWVHRHVKDLDGAELNLEVVSPGKAVPFEPGRWLWGRTVRFCKGYRITMAEETVEITDAGLYHCSGEDAEENGEILIPERETSGRVVHQVQDFMDENDQYQEHEADEEEALMQTFILAHRSETPEAMLAAVLESARLRDYPALAGRSYRVQIGKEGRVTVRASA